MSNAIGLRPADRTSSQPNATMPFASPTRSWLEGGPGNPDHAALEDTLTGLQQESQQVPDNAALHRSIGELLAELGRVDEARDRLRRAAKLASTEPRNWKGLELLEMKAARWSHAVDAARRVVELEPANVDSLANICWALRGTGDLSRAVEAGERAVATDGDNLKARDYLSFAYLAADDCRAALASCEMGWRIEPRRSLSLALMHAALDGLGRREEARAIADFERLIWVAPPLRPPAGFATVDGFNQALASAAMGAPNRPLDPTQTGNLLADPTGPVAEFRTVIDDAVRMYLAHLEAIPNRAMHPFARHQPSRWSVEGWANRGTSIPALEHHIHNQAWVSGVYYARVPAYVGDAAHGRDGFLEFCRFPRFSSREVESEFAALPPREGLLVLFPSYFYHRISPYAGTEMRISLAFDVTPTD